MVLICNVIIHHFYLLLFFFKKWIDGKYIKKLLWMIMAIYQRD